MRPPGTLLLALARLLFEDSVLSRAVHPTIADLQDEVRQAGTDRRRRLLARWRGYTAFWILVLSSPIAFWSWPMNPNGDRRALLNVSALIVAALLVVVVLTTSGAMVPFGYVFEGVPAAVSGMLGDVHMLAFTAGPGALVLLLVVRGLGGPVRFTVQPAEATLLTLLSATVAVTTGAVVFVNVFAGIASTGGGGLNIVLEAGALSLEGLMYAVGSVTACLLVVTTLTMRASRQRSTAPADPTGMPAGIAVALAVVMCLTLLAVHLLLRTYYRTLGQMLSLFTPGQSVRGIGDTAELLGHNMGLLFAGGVVLTVFLGAAGTITWRVSRTRTPHAILTWASRAALAIVMVGAFWHAAEARTTLAKYRELTPMKASPAANRN